VTLTVEAGEFLCIHGASGSGKTTLLHLLAGLIEPEKGHIQIGQHVIDRLDEAGRARVRREIVGTLSGIGMSPAWIRGVVWYQQAVILIIGAALGALVSIVPVVAAVTRIPGFVLGVPWAQCLTLALAVLVGCVTATALSARRVTQR
jgi:energy-coupling factor transporter ATP-binding protein EcfA2